MVEEIKYKGTDEIVYYEKIFNGIDVYMYPIKNAKNFYMTFNVRFGSLNTEFKYENEKSFNKVPQGTAHFLEHQLFMEEDGTAFESFARLGTSVNAFTTYDLTCYEAIASDHFKENLETLLNFVQNPVFKPGNVTKEKAIIKEEIQMYDNNPSAVLTFGLENNLNIKDKHKYLISGTKENVLNIDAEILYQTYNAYYQPENMFIVITGNFKPHEAVGIIKENQLSKNFEPYKKIINKTTQEPAKVFESYEERCMNVNIPKVKIGFKYSKEDFKGIDKTILKVYLDAILYLKFGPSSDLSEKLENENLLNFDLLFSYDIREDYVVIFIEFESLYKEEVMNLIESEIQNIGVSDEEIKRIKRIDISNFIFHFNDLVSVCESLQDDIVREKKVVSDIYDLYKKMNKKDANKIANLLKKYAKTVFVINKENQA